MVFDSLAPSYDTDFTHSPIARLLRARVHARLDQLAAAGDCVLELGCGTGEDALHLAQRGVRILATDASAAMLEQARAKLEGYAQAQVARLDIRALNVDDTQTARPYALAFANFGVLNCLPGWRTLATWLAARVYPGGYAAFGIMSPLCLWEIGWHAAHGAWDTAFRRLRRHGAAFTSVRASASHAPTHTAAVERIFYPSIARLSRDFAPHFRRTHVEPLGLLLPPSDVYGVIERRPRLLRLLTAGEEHVRGARFLALLADHYWIEFERLP
jgi:SAM-dependent methyltransferase